MASPLKPTPQNGSRENKKSPLTRSRHRLLRLLPVPGARSASFGSEKSRGVVWAPFLGVVPFSYVCVCVFFVGLLFLSFCFFGGVLKGNQRATTTHNLWEPAILTHTQMESTAQAWFPGLPTIQERAELPILFSCPHKPPTMA